jgi:hypothetical protein
MDLGLASADPAGKVRDEIAGSAVASDARVRAGHAA